MTWDPNTQPHDKLFIDSVEAPGVCKLTKFDRKRRLLKVEPYGAMGARVISLGAYLAEFSFTISLTGSEEWAAWWPFNAAINRIPIGPKGKAHGIVWAPLAAYGILACLIESIEGPLEDGETGGWVVTVNATQWVPIAKPALSSPAEEEKPPEPKRPGETIIEKLEAIAKKGGPNRLEQVARL